LYAESELVVRTRQLLCIGGASYGRGEAIGIYCLP
jgi:hypothetical protein